jgi:tetratricopeptide (TPR) repeat protein
MGAAILGVALVREPLALAYGSLSEAEDTYALPGPHATQVLSLGYRSAAADFIYAHVLVSYGLHFQQQRRFEHVGDYLETLSVLDPQFVQPYLFADTLLTMQSKPAQERDYDRARQLLLRGTEVLPYNQELWLVAGQFIAYVAPPHLSSPAKSEEWKLEGARLLARACELATKNRNIPYHCVAAATLLNRAGQREALIRMLTRTLAVNDDEEIQKLALASLGSWVGEREREQYQARARAFNERWRSDLPFISKEQQLLLGPRTDALGCVGLGITGRLPNDPCLTTWALWSQAWDSTQAQGD